MIHPIEIENIEQLRRQEGIEDVELHRAIRGLRAGDIVKLTLLNGATLSAGETLRVRITRVRGKSFRGKLAERPRSAGLSNLSAGSLVVFTSDHIHSLPAQQSSEEE
jgi:hypothetical protein